MSVPLRRGSPNLVTLDAREAGKECIPACCVLLSQPVASDAVWRIVISVKTENNRAQLGVATLSNPQAGSAPSRVVALCYVPGAVAWDVTAELVSGTPGNQELLDIAASECCGGEFGARFLEGDPAPAPGATRQYVTIPGVDGVANIPAGVGVVGIAARADAGTTTATVEIAAQGPAAVPEAGALSLAPPFDPRTGEPTLRGPVAITFTDTSSYVIETVQ